MEEVVVKCWSVGVNAAPEFLVPFHLTSSMKSKATTGDDGAYDGVGEGAAGGTS